MTLRPALAVLLPVLASGIAGCARTEMVDLRNDATGQLTRCEMVVQEEGVRVPASLVRSTSARACPAKLAETGWRPL